jgi:hypothetical protein
MITGALLMLPLQKILLEWIGNNAISRQSGTG